MWLIMPIAGIGRRLQPFTYSKPKAFVKVAGKRLIDHLLIKLKKAFSKGTNICFIVGYKKRQMKEYLIKNHSEYFNLEFVVQKPLGYSAETPYFSGLGDAVLLAKKYAENDDIFILFGGSGSEIMLTKNLKRNFISCEIHPEYYNMILDRLNNNGEIKSEFRLKFIQGRNKHQKQQVTLFG